MNFDPKIIAFCCNWGAYPAADLAGRNRTQYPSTIRIIRVPCSGMVHPDMILHALKKGADGVMIVGCPLNECHYLDGNYKALAHSEIISEILEKSGFEAERFQLFWISAGESDQLVRVFNKMIRSMKQLGPHSGVKMKHQSTP